MHIIMANLFLIHVRQFCADVPTIHCLLRSLCVRPCSITFPNPPWQRRIWERGGHYSYYLHHDSVRMFQALFLYTLCQTQSRVRRLHGCVRKPVTHHLIRDSTCLGRVGTNMLLFWQGITTAAADISI